MSCPDENTLLEFTQGMLSDEQMAVFDAHLDVCSDCSEAVVELARSQSLARLLTGAHADPPPANTLSLATWPGPGGTSKPSIQRGTEFGRYVILHLLGAGGMGVVYAAYDSKLDRKIALEL